MRKRTLHWFVALALLPLVAAGVFVGLVRFQALFRFNQAYFTAVYRLKYDTPGSVALALEEALQTGDVRLIRELQGLRRSPSSFESNPDVYTILVEVDEAGYFHYMYYDVKTFDREFHYIKEIGDRWVYVPTDAFFYLDSGQWLRVFSPLAIIYYAIYTVITLGLLTYWLAARFRQARLEEAGS